MIFLPHGQPRTGIIDAFVSDIALPGEGPPLNNLQHSQHHKAHFQALPPIDETTQWTKDSNVSISIIDVSSQYLIFTMDNRGFVGAVAIRKEKRVHQR